MKKRVIIGIISTAILLFGIAGSMGNQTQPSNINNTTTTDSNFSAKDATKISTPVCDGTVVTTNCAIDGVSYTSYTYHPAVAEKSHTETVTTYKEEIAGYCTLCNDGTYSPSCATGRGACSHHGGVDQWNAPRYKSVPEYSSKTIVDAPAKEAYYNKIVK